MPLSKFEHRVRGWWRAALGGARQVWQRARAAALAQRADAAATAAATAAAHAASENAAAAARTQPPRAVPRVPLLACVTVAIPALNEAERIASVVAYALADPATAEVLVIDDSSTDDTARLAQQAGARVITSSLLGKGASMRDAVQHARHELLVFLDGDLAGLRPGIVSDLCQPLWADQADFVKARFGRASGRVTELTAKPMLKVFFPELAHFAQPLGGLIAARRSLLQTLEMEDGYGVDVGLLLDAQRAGARLAEVDIGGLEHNSQPLHDLTAMANEVSRVIYNRARLCGRLHVEQISNMFEAQRQATATLEYALSRRRGQRWLVLLDLDGSVTPGHFVQALAHSAGKTAALQAWSQTDQTSTARNTSPSTLPSTSSITSHNALAQEQARQELIAMLFRFMHRRQIEQVARELPLRPGIVALVNQLRRAGFMVGVLSDGYFVAADIIRRRIFADFALAHSLVFEGDVCSGQWRCNPAFVAPASSAGPALCKGQVLQRLRDEARVVGAPWAQIWALGDGLADLGLLQGADRAFALVGAPPAVLHLPGMQAIDSFDDMLQQLPAWLPAAAAQAA